MALLLWHISRGERPWLSIISFGISEEDLVEVFKICGFYHNKRSCLKSTVFREWAVASFDVGTVEVSTFKKRTVIKIGMGDFPKRPASQLDEGLEPPKFRMQSTTEGQSSKDSLMLLFNKPRPPEATATTTTAAATMTTSTVDITRIATTTAATAGASSPPVPHSPVKLSQQFHISSPDKQRLAIELVCDMDTPQKAPLVRELVKGSSFYVETLNNQKKKYIHIPQCSNEASAMSQNVKHKFAQEIVKTLGAGAETTVDGLHKGAIWLCKGITEVYKAEYAHSAAGAGLSCISRMSPKATAAMWTDAKLTKTKSRKVSSHLSHWFKQPITAKEQDVDALAGRQHVKRKYDSYEMTSQKGKKQSGMTSRDGDGTFQSNTG